MASVERLFAVFGSNVAALTDALLLTNHCRAWSHAGELLGLSTYQTREARFQNRALGLLSLQLSTKLFSAILVAFQVKLCEAGIELL